jgi:hypothetical protein
VTGPTGPTFHFREITPKDFYLAQILRQSERNQIEIFIRLLLNPEALDQATASQTRAVFKWAGDTLLDKTILTVENWLEVAFGLCKQRWGPAVDWLESQPMSKVNAMIDVVKRHADEQEKEMKKAARRKK